jgi:hypothetical protein
MESPRDYPRASTITCTVDAMEHLGSLLTGIGLLIGVPILVFLIGAGVHWMAFEILPSTWDAAGSHTKNPVVRGILAALYAALIASLTLAIVDAGCARAIG